MSTQVMPEVLSATRPRVLEPYLLAAGCVAGAWLLYHAFSPLPKFPLDDPYITLHSAQVLHWGFDPNYPGVSALSGATSAPFLGLVYLLLFFLSPLRALETACWLGILAYVLGLVYLTRVLKLSRFASLAIVALGLITAVTPFHLLNGLETTLAMASVIWALSYASDGKPLPSAFAAGLAGAIRPDLFPFTILLVAALAFELPPKSRRQFLTLGTLLAITPLALSAVAYMIGTGHPFPLTGIAKRYYIGSASLPGPRKIELELLLLALYCVFCGPILLAFKKAVRNPVAIAILGSAAAMLIGLYVQFPDGLGANYFRYPVVFTPMIVWAIAIYAQQESAKRLLTVSLIYSSVISLPYSLYVYVHDCRRYDAGIHEAADWCNKNLPSDARIMVVDAGYMSFATTFRLVDCAGLKTPEAIEFNRRFTWPSHGDNRAQAMTELALQDKATYLINLREHTGLKKVPSAIQALGWNVQLLKNVQLYGIYRMSPPDHTRNSESQNTATTQSASSTRP